MEIRACNVCAGGKRKCDKKTPSCSRCQRRGIECIYPPAKPTGLIFSGIGDPWSVQETIFPDSNTPCESHSPGPQTTEGNDDLSYSALDPDLSRLSDPVGYQLPLTWFTPPATWNIDQSSELNSFASREQKRHINKLYRWLTQWVEQGSNPFIHSRLYRSRFPRGVQDAYAALSCYLHKTTSNERMIFQIIEDRAKQLIVEQGGIPLAVTSTVDVNEGINENSAKLDLLGHIARVQALLVYQILGLYDGDIRLRHLAESHMPVLNSWVQEMVEHASQTVCLDGPVTTSAHLEAANGLNLFNIAHRENPVWYNWVFAESIQRTWIIASGIQTIYSMIQHGRQPPCQGSITFNSHQGVWEAQSALAWEKLCSEGSIGIIQMAEAYRLFTEAIPEDVNEFTKGILEAIYGVEKMERWGVVIQD